MRLSWGLAVLAASGCHALIGIEDTVAGAGGDGVIGLDRVIVAEVRSSQMPVLGGSPGPSTGALVLIDFLEDAAPDPIYDDRDAGGLGCTVHVRDSISIAHGRDEGQVQVFGTRTAVPPCAPFDPLDRRYACAEVRASSPADVQLVNAAGGEAVFQIPGANPPFSNADIGNFLLVADGPPRPIDAVGDGDSAVVFDPFAVDLGQPESEHAVIAGLGPTPVSEPFFEGPVTITKLNGDQTEGFTVETMAAGATYRLDDGSSRPEALPLDGEAPHFSCSGLNGDCGGGSHTLVWAKTTDVRGPALPLSTELAPITGAEAELRCLFEGPDVEVPAAAMQALIGASPRRIVAAVLRGTIDVPANADGSRPTVVFTGFGEYGWTTISQPDDDCDGVFQDCSPGLRCTVVGAARRCVDDGTAARGEMCSDASSPDDCQAGNVCVFDRCSPTCDFEDASCNPGERCILAGNMLVDFCIEDCDPLDQAGSCDGGNLEACYVLTDFGFCGLPPNGVFTAAGEPCTFRNECEPGTQCNGNIIDGSDPRCRTLCDASGNDPDNRQCGTGGCGSNELCIEIDGSGNPFGYCLEEAGTPCDCAQSPACP